jgi:hypothetical protein
MQNYKKKKYDNFLKIYRILYVAGLFSNLYCFNNLTHAQVLNLNTLKILSRISGFKNFKLREENSFLLDYSLLGSIWYLLCQLIVLIYTSINVIESKIFDKKIYTKNKIASVIK